MIGKREKELINLSKQGDVLAFEELIAMHKKKLFFFALNITGGKYEEAEDILQEALVKAFFGIRKIQGTLYFTSWMWKILRNVLHNAIRKRACKEILLEDAKYIQLPSKECVEEETVKEEMYRNIRMLVGLLPMKYREAIALVDLQEMTYEEAAQVLDISSGVVKTRVFRGRKKLAELVGKNRELFR